MIQLYIQFKSNTLFTDIDPVSLQPIFSRVIKTYEQFSIFKHRRKYKRTL